jgi:hypothetical protein
MEAANKKYGSVIETSSLNTESISGSDITKFNKTGESFLGATPKFENVK